MSDPGNARMTFRITTTAMACARCERLPAGERCPDRCARNFVLSAWSTSLKPSRDAGMITAKNYPRVMHEEIAAICTRPEARVHIAHGTEATAYLGFIAGEPSERIVYYCFVKELYRRHGIARALFAELGIDPRSRFVYPCATRATFELRGKIPLAVRDPAVARYPKAERHRSYA